MLFSTNKRQESRNQSNNNNINKRDNIKNNKMKHEVKRRSCLSTGTRKKLARIIKKYSNELSEILNFNND